MSEELDRFKISRIVVVYHQITPKPGVMYVTLSFENYISFNGTDDDLKRLVIKEARISRDTDSLKHVTVYGFGEEFDYQISNKKDYAAALRDWCDAVLEGDEDHYWVPKEEECYSFILDDRKKDNQ